MSNAIFIMLFMLLAAAVYVYTNKRWKKREKEFDDFAYEMQRDFSENTQSLSTGIDFYDRVKTFYEDQGYTLSKHPDFVTDYIGKRDKEILFIRVQGPQDKQSITAQLLQTFIGQTAMYALDNPLYAEYELRWVYVCSKMMCDQSARIYIKKYENRLKFELLEAV